MTLNFYVPIAMQSTPKRIISFLGNSQNDRLDHLRYMVSRRWRKEASRVRIEPHPWSKGAGHRRKRRNSHPHRREEVSRDGIPRHRHESIRLGLGDEESIRARNRERHLLER